MGNSLQDQLLKAGLVSEEQVRNANKPPPRKGPKRKGPDKRRKRANQAPNDASNRTQGARRRDGNAQADSSRGAKKSANDGRPTIEELNAKIRALLDTHRQNVEEAEVPYNFTRESRIKKLYVTEEQRTKLLAGELAIAGYRRIHHVIPRAVADEIQSLREEIFVHRADDPEPESGQAAELPEDGDEHAIPDDLVW